MALHREWCCHRCGCNLIALQWASCYRTLATSCSTCHRHIDARSEPCTPRLLKVQQLHPGVSSPDKQGYKPPHSRGHKTDCSDSTRSAQGHMNIDAKPEVTAARTSSCSFLLASGIVLRIAQRTLPLQPMQAAPVASAPSSQQSRCLQGTALCMLPCNLHNLWCTTRVTGCVTL